MMPTFLQPIHEFNKCHEPGGSPVGGRFCSRDAFMPRPARKPLPFTRRPIPGEGTQRLINAAQARVFMTPKERHQWEVLRKQTFAAQSAHAEMEQAVFQGAVHLAAETIELRHRHEDLATRMRDFADEVTRRAVGEIAKELDFPPERIRIVNNENPREFEVGGEKWKEGGHYQYADNTIEINIANMHGLSLVKALAHEIQHSKFEVWRSAIQKESGEIYEWVKGREHEIFMGNGDVRPEYRVEFNRRFPAHRAAHDTWGHAYTASSLSQKMIAADGFTDYSKAYWKDAKDPDKQKHYHHVSFTGQSLFGSTLYRAVDETLAEVAAWRVQRRMLPPTKADRERPRMINYGSTPKPPARVWRKFAARINQFYRAHGHKYGVT